VEVLFSSPTCFSTSTILGVDKIAIAIFSLAIAVLLLLLLRRGFSTKSKIFLIYGHLAFLFFPFVLLTLSLPIAASNWGIRELSAVAFLGPLGATSEQLTAASVLYGLTTLAAALPGLLHAADFAATRPGTETAPPAGG